MMRINLVIAAQASVPSDLDEADHRRKERVQAVPSTSTDRPAQKPCPVSGKCKQAAA